MKQLDVYTKAQQDLFDYFGYIEDWVVIPIDDAREYYWKLNGTGPGEVLFGETIQDVEEETGDHYVNEIYTQRFLPKWVYEGEEFTMICVDTHVDGNKFLQIFDNSKRITEYT